ncbi:carbohydrate ABC transporter permease [Georgenia faecalis]|uniref:Carbohydrate ABC transporter permease n=1 Tax=Georgenia faecalis TaxID=2483799 RepID=A0ABV9D6L5_9MICO|nr:sugar ABC transporter permease [Georgenia faecalis]
MPDLTLSGRPPEAGARAGLSPARPGRRRGSLARHRRSAAALALVLPAAFFYGAFVLRPLIITVQYSLYEWNGVTESTWVGAANYVRLLQDPEMFGPILNALQLIVYFSFVPVTLGLVAAAIIRKFATSRLAVVGRTVLFLPQVIPLVAAGIMWTWIMASDGVVNQFLRLIGLGSITRAWLGDFSTALSGVGVIGAWVSLGLCLVLLLAGMSKIDPALYEAARLDGAGPIREFWSVTLPSLRQELAVCLTVTVIAALASFDIIYISTQGGPGNSTMVPGLEIYYLAFFQREVGQASALAVALMALVLIVVIPLQRVIRGREQ